MSHRVVSVLCFVGPFYSSLVFGMEVLKSVLELKPLGVEKLSSRDLLFHSDGKPVWPNCGVPLRERP